MKPRKKYKKIIKVNGINIVYRWKPYKAGMHPNLVDAAARKKIQVKTTQLTFFQNVAR